MPRKLRSVGVFHEGYDTVVRIMRHDDDGNAIHTTEVVNPANVHLLMSVLNDMVDTRRALVMSLLTHGYIVVA